jgi:putative ABC transport system ATP-binding protein
VYPNSVGSVPVLAGVDLSIAHGEIVALRGPSGSGKSTLLNILGCLDRPTRGSYFLDGRDVSMLDDAGLSHVRNNSIGFIFQSFNLIAQLSVLENVEVPLFYARVPRRDRHRRCKALLDTIGLSHRLAHHPTQLSGGECQRVAVARALVNEPALLLADEPTGNLDTNNGAEVMRLLHELHGQGRTIVIVTHNPEIADALPRVVEMRDGNIVRERTLAAAGG